MDLNGRYSRPLATASDLAANVADAHRFVEKRVLLTGTPAALATQNGREIARCAVLLLMRICRNVVVSLPADARDFLPELKAWAEKHKWDLGPDFTIDQADLEEYDAILAIGGEPDPDHPLTTITSDGWLVRVSSGAELVAQSMAQTNPVGALAAASLGVGEIFKRLLPIDPAKGDFLDGATFSLWTYQGGVDPGPQLPVEFNVSLLVAGAGAIGHGVGHLLSRLPVRGYAAVLDRQSYGEENWGTCLRLTRDASTQPKAPFLTTIIGERLTATPYEMPIEELSAVTDWQHPPIVLNGFDNVEARHAAQDLWPDLIIDGAIGRRLECQVSCHPWPGPVACLRCVFKKPTGERAVAVQSRVTGLPEQALADLQTVLTEEHVAAAAPDKQPWLRERIGKPMCSILDEVRELAAAAVREGFRPSVPFVATMSACMMIAELVRYLTEGAVASEPRFQFSFLRGPQKGEHYPEDRHGDCVCMTRAGNIEKVRQSRPHRARSCG